MGTDSRQRPLDSLIRHRLQHVPAGACCDIDQGWIGGACVEGFSPEVGMEDRSRCYRGSAVVVLESEVEMPDSADRNTPH
jgi:hypothetical protein